MPPTNAHDQLLLATRIHHALMRYLGSGIDVGAMVERDGYAREVLYVCAGSGDAELQALGEQFARLRRPLAAPREDVPFEAAPSASDFGDDDLPPAPAAPLPGWRRWLRRLRPQR